MASSNNDASANAHSGRQIRLFEEWRRLKRAAVLAKRAAESLRAETTTTTITMLSIARRLDDASCHAEMDAEFAQMAADCAMSKMRIAEAEEENRLADEERKEEEEEEKKEKERVEGEEKKSAEREKTHDAMLNQLMKDHKEEEKKLAEEEKACVAVLDQWKADRRREEEEKEQACLTKLVKWVAGRSSE